MINYYASESGYGHTYDCSEMFFNQERWNLVKNNLLESDPRWIEIYHWTEEYHNMNGCKRRSYPLQDCRDQYNLPSCYL